MIYLKLFWSFFQIGLFSIGGGYAALPLIQERIVEINGWLNLEEFADVITISQMTPGPIALNAATFVGIQIAGIPGAILATIGCITPSCIIVLTLAYLYNRYRGFSVIQGILRGLRPAVVALIGAAGLSLVILAIYKSGEFTIQLNDIDFVAGGIFITGLILLKKFKCNPVLVMLGSGLAGFICYTFIF